MQEMATQLTIRLFGTPEVEANQAPLNLNNQKARALLFYLAATQQPHTRNHLATLLWSEFPASNARRSLRAALFQLRQALKAANINRVLIAEGNQLRLRPANIKCDMHHFYRLVEQGSEQALTRAIALYRGPLLEGFTLPDTPLFDEWVRLEDERLTQAYLNALERLASQAETRQNRDKAIGYLQRLVQTDPLVEDAQQRLIELYLQTGAASQALRQYQQFEAKLQQTLGLGPAPKTRALYQEALRLQQHTFSPAEKTLRPALKNRPAQPALPFVGRNSLLTQLLTISQKAETGQGITVLLQGEGGIGKTRLLNEFLTRLLNQPTPWLALQGACSPFDDLISYGPFLEAFQNTTLGAFTDLLLEPQTDTPDARGQFAHRVLQTLRQLSHNSPVVLAIDDLQWANSSTLNLFGLLATRLHHLPMILIGTTQRVEAIPALQRLVTMERRRGQLQLLPLTPLAQDAITELLQGLNINPTSPLSFAEWLQERSGGNPFILEEIVAQLRADSILVQAGNSWRLDAGRWLRWRTTFTLPETTHDLVSWRLRNLSPEARHLLDVLAVAGQPLPFALLTDFPGIPNGQLLPIIDDLLARRLAVENSDEMFALPHHLLRETILHQLSHVRRRMIHRQLANKLKDCPALQANTPLWEIARHAVAGEDIELARRYGLQILSRLPQDSIGAVTVDFLHHLYDLLTPSASPDEILGLTRAIGDVYQSLGQLQQATCWQQQYLDLALKTGDPADQATAYFERGELALVSNDYAAATQAAEAGLSARLPLSESNPNWAKLSGRGHRLLGAALAMEGSDLPAAENHLQQAIAAHRQADSPRDLCASLFELGNIAAQRGELLRALEFYEEAAHVAEASQIHYIHALAQNNFAYHSLLLGWLKAAQRALLRGQKLAEDHQLLGALLHLYSTQGEIHLYLGEWEAANQVFQRGFALAEELGNPERQAGYRAGLALAARGQHNLAAATALLEEALLLISGRGYWHLRARLLIWLAETLLLTGRISEASLRLHVALETAHSQGRMLLLLQAQRLHARLLAAGGDWPTAEACFAKIMAQATKLDLPLEIARTQAAWGEAILRYAPSAGQGQPLLAQAGQVLADHHARAELDALQLAQ